MQLQGLGLPENLLHPERGVRLQVRDRGGRRGLQMHKTLRLRLRLLQERSVLRIGEARALLQHEPRPGCGGALRLGRGRAGAVLQARLQVLRQSVLPLADPEVRRGRLLRLQAWQHTPVRGDCCNPKRQKCCPGSISEKHCAPKDSICCGPKSCPPTQKCCKGTGGGGFYPGLAGAACFPKTFECCGSSGYNEATAKCCGDGLVCPKDAICCDRECCSGGKICTDGGCKAPTEARASRRRTAAARRQARAVRR